MKDVFRLQQRETNMGDLLGKPLECPGKREEVEEKDKEALSYLI